MNLDDCARLPDCCFLPEEATDELLTDEQRAEIALFNTCPSED